MDENSEKTFCKEMLSKKALDPPGLEGQRHRRKSFSLPTFLDRFRIIFEKTSGPKHFEFFLIFCAIGTCLKRFPETGRKSSPPLFSAIRKKAFFQHSQNFKTKCVSVKFAVLYPPGLEGAAPQAKIFWISIIF